MTDNNNKKYCTSITTEYDCPIELDWLSTDSLSTFEKLSKAHQGYWNQRQRDNNPIKYDLNKYGFRSDEFPEKECRESITFIGCSNTVGIGVAKEDSWTYQVANELGLDEINLGIAAGSSDSAFRVYNEWQPIHKSKITCFLLPPPNRLETVGQDMTTWQNVGHWTLDKEDKEGNPINEFMPQEVTLSLLHEELCNVRVDRNIAAVSWIAHKTNSNLIVIPYTGKVSKNDKLDTGRDCCHGGLHTNKFYAQRFLDGIKNA